ncbi:MAG: MFS transporter [Faecousia sp.]
MTHLLLAIIYLSFISLGLPDAVLGAAWPTIYEQFGIPVSYGGILSTIISVGTIVSSLQSDRMTKWLGSGKVTAISVAMTALALFGFSVSNSFWMLCLWAVPYGLGAGGVDASLNNYVALHYSSRHMSWLHCMWGLGASVGPYIMTYALTAGQGWPMGYRYISLLQMALTAVLLLSLPLWKKRPGETESAGNREMALTLRQVIAIPGAPEVLLMFFCYCALEQTAGLWGASYLVMKDGLSAEKAAGFGSLFYIGITVGRAVSGFLTMKFDDTQMIRIGLGILVLGVVVMLLPIGYLATVAGLLLVGLGCAPVYPCVIHSTPTHFGAENSQALIGVQMACAYMGSLLMPPLFGLIADFVSAAWMPLYLAAILLLMTVMHERLNRKSPIAQP